MSDLIKFNLPKVKVRVRTTPSESCLIDISKPLFKEYTAAPSIFQERLKMKKQIQDSYLRFRKKKKANYMKPLNNTKKVSLHRQERENSLLVKNKTNPLLNQFDFSLEVDPHNRENNHAPKRSHERLHVITCLSNKKRESPNRELLTGSYKETPQCLIVSRRNSLQDSELYTDDLPMQLSGKKCKYSHFQVTKKLLNYIEEHNKRKIKKRESKYQKSNSFNIDPWRADNMSKLSQEEEKDFRQEC